jgi:hypothetical protein
MIHRRPTSRSASYPPALLRTAALSLGPKPTGIVSYLVTGLRPLLIWAAASAIGAPSRGTD